MAWLLLCCCGCEHAWSEFAGASCNIWHLQVLWAVGLSQVADIIRIFSAYASDMLSKPAVIGVWCVGKLMHVFSVVVFSLEVFQVTVAGGSKRPMSANLQRELLFVMDSKLAVLIFDSNSKSCYSVVGHVDNAIIIFHNTNHTHGVWGTKITACQVYIQKKRVAANDWINNSSVQGVGRSGV